MSALTDFWTGFKQGKRETPVAFFAPAIAVWRLFADTTDDLTKPR